MALRERIGGLSYPSLFHVKLHEARYEYRCIVIWQLRVLERHGHAMILRGSYKEVCLRTVALCQQLE